jgi:TonB-linked SusC/RagA family outer membrane protein
MKIKRKRGKCLDREGLLLTGIKSIIFFYCTLVFVLRPYEGFSQDVRVRIDTDVVLSVIDVFHLIEGQTDYEFIYRPALLEGLSPVKIARGEMRTEDLLDKILSPAYFSYEFYNNTIIVRKKVGSSGATTAAQTVEVWGTVTDREGNPRPGVTVLVKGSENGVVTDFDGNYRIKVAAGGVLSFSFMGFAPREIIIEAGSSVIDVQLEEQAARLKDVVVTGYQKLSVNKSTGATQTITGEELEQKGQANLMSALQGMFQGLNFAADPQNEGQTKYTVRGISTLAGDSSPLIVVDGFPLEADISSINPYEVETITLLKDAAAASIYGSRAANGVLVITTKKGEKGKVRVNYRNELTITGRPDLAYRLNRISAADLVDIERSYAEDNNAQTYWKYLEDGGRRNPSRVTPRNQVYNTVAMVNEGRMSQAEAEEVFDRLKGIDNTGQWKKHFYRNDFQHQSNLSLNGGSERYTFRSTLNYTANKGNKVGQKDDNLIFDIVNNIDLGKGIDLDIAGNVVINSSESTPFDEFYIKNISPYENLVDEEGNALPVLLPYRNYSSDNNGLWDGKEPEELQRLIDLGLYDETFYPLKELGMQTINAENSAIRLQLRLNAKLSNDLKGNFNFQYETGSSVARDLRKKDSWIMKSLINNMSPYEYNGAPGTLPIPPGGRQIETRRNRRSYTLRGQLDFNRSFGEHSIVAIAGSEIRHVFSQGTITDQFGYDESSGLFHPIDKKRLSQFPTKGTNHPGGSSDKLDFLDDFEETLNRYFSLYGNYTYSFKNRYILSGSVRLDQSNLFGTDPKYRYKPFWSVGGKWRLSEEGFFNSSVVNNIALRVSYGINGNISNTYGPFNMAEFTIPYNLKSPALKISTPAINDLRWEKTATTNAGLDLGFFNNRISLSLDYYIKQTKDLLALGMADPTQGFSTLMYNEANIDNKGIEIGVNTVNVQAEKFNWSTRITFSHNKNMVTKVYREELFVSNPYFAAGIRNFEGMPANSFYIYTYAGLNEEGYPMITTGNGDELVLAPGFNEEVIDQIDARDLHNGGTAVPVYSGSVINNLTYGPFGLSFMFVGSGGHVLLKDSYNGTGGIYLNPAYVHADAAQGWKQPGDEAHTGIPDVRELYVYQPNILQYSTKNVIPGDFIRLRELIFTYSIPQQALKKTFIKAARFNLRGNNLFLVTRNRQGIDPESHGLGVRYFPLQPSYSLGFTLNF